MGAGLPTSDFSQSVACILSLPCSPSMAHHFLPNEIDTRSSACISLLSTVTVSSHPRLPGTIPVLALSPKSQKSLVFGKLDSWALNLQYNSNPPLQPFPCLLPHHWASVNLEIWLIDCIPQFSLSCKCLSWFFYPKSHFCLHTTSSQRSGNPFFRKERLFLFLMLIGNL